MKILNKKGFTVIELLVVIAIIAMISSFAFTSLKSTRAKARDVRREEDIKQVQTALDLYAVTYRRFPDCGTDQVIIGSPGDACLSIALINAGAISGLPGDPVGGGSGTISDCGVTAGMFIYCYLSVNEGASYEITYNLETGNIPGKLQGWQLPPIIP